MAQIPRKGASLGLPEAKEVVEQFPTGNAGGRSYHRTGLSKKTNKRFIN